MKKFLIFVVAIVSIGMLASSSLGTFLFAAFSIFPYFSETFAGSVGTNPWMAKFLAVIFTVSAFFGIRGALSWNREKRSKGFVWIAATFAAMFLIGYFASKDHNFDPKTGEALVNVSPAPNGARLVPKSWNYDPTYGNRVVPANPENIVGALRSKSSDKGAPSTPELENLKTMLESQ